MKKPLLLSFIGYSGSGKTSIIEKVASILTKKGYKVCYIKHDPKDRGITDKKGSGTYRVKENTYKAVLFSPTRLTLWQKNEKDIFGLIDDYLGDCHIILIEGFKNIDNIPKIAIGNIDAKNVIMRIGGTESLNDIINLIEGYIND